MIAFHASLLRNGLDIFQFGTIQNPNDDFRFMEPKVVLPKPIPMNRPH
jgi:hypothetical protein